jgi:hypothetical protein
MSRRSGRHQRLQEELRRRKLDTTGVTCRTHFVQIILTVLPTAFGDCGIHATHGGHCDNVLAVRQACEDEVANNPGTWAHLARDLDGIGQMGVHFNEASLCVLSTVLGNDILVLNFNIT